LTHPRYAIVGTLTLDSVIAADGRSFVGKCGGNALWGAMGARLWSRSIGIVARAGTDYPEQMFGELTRAGIDIGGVSHTGAPHGLRVAYRHLPDGRREQPVPAEALKSLPPEHRAAFVDTTRDPAARVGSDPTLADIPPAWLSSVDLWHLPLLPLRTHRDILAGLTAYGTTRVTADCPNRYEIGDLVSDMAPTLPALEAFLPSTSDLDVISPGADAARIAEDLARASGRTVVLKQGDQGCLVLTGEGDAWRIPAYPGPVVDPTGAGDAFCGGFMTGLGDTGDVVLAAARGAVSASFAVETAYPVEALHLDPADADLRLAHIRDHITKA
jgi:ribokinase